MNNLMLIWKKYSFSVLFAVMTASLFDFRIALCVVSCLIGPIAFSFFKGRFWCGNICPRGSFYDNILVKWSRHRRVPYLVKTPFFRLGVILVMMSLFSIGIYKNWGNWKMIGFVFYRMIVVTTFIGVIFSFIWNERSWCHFCPMGSISAFVARLRKSNQVLHVSLQCVSCGLCKKKCPMGISAYTYKNNILSASDCIQCGQCVFICPKKAISYEVPLNQ